MANSPSQKWENGVLVERAIETNRWKVNPDGTPVDEDDDAAQSGSFRDDIETKPIRKITKK